MNAPGHPARGPEIPRPEQVLDFATLYKQNCAGCHGENGKNGAAVSLANPVYLAIAGEATVRQVVAKGVAGKLMPGFGKSAGGTLTDQQIGILVQGIIQTWSRADILAGAQPPSYTAGAKSDPKQGKKVFDEFCSQCHGTDGNGQKAAVGNGVSGSIIDPSYLMLVTDQSLRSTIIAGRPDLGMPDWRSDASGPGSRAMTDQEITDAVAWLASHRAASQE
jgi:cytochrome c oxidase cbb3-type subunit 3/ubiquinol-cytochrome c reductase cytochrome c subunit